MDRNRNQNRSRKGRRSKSSERWLTRQRKDPFARKAAETGRGSRAHFKLEQLDQRFSLLKPGMKVLELGAAPGGWTCYVEEKVAPGGMLVAVDERPITAGTDTIVVEGLFGASEVDNKIAEILGDHKVDLVLSDMAPNISGIRTADQARSMELVALTEGAVQAWLKPNGAMVVKIFQGEGIEEWIRDVRARFGQFKQVKPEASRADSREMYAVAQGYLGSAAGR